MGLTFMENIQQQASNVLLGIAGTSDRFVLKYGWFTFRLKIKPLTCKQLIAISSEISQINDINKDQDMFPALMSGIKDIRYIAKIIAISTGTRFQRIVTRAILKLPLKDVDTLFSIVHKQSDMSRFFFIIAKTGRMNLLKKQE
jgi:hypothetical protein